MKSLRAHFCLSGSKHRDEDLRQTMGDHSRAVRRAPLGKVYADIAKFKLFSAVGTVAIVVENFYTRALRE